MKREDAMEITITCCDCKHFGGDPGLRTCNKHNRHVEVGSSICSQFIHTDDAHNTPRDGVRCCPGCGTPVPCYNCEALARKLEEAKARIRGLEQFSHAEAEVMTAAFIAAGQPEIDDGLGDSPHEPTDLALELNEAKERIADLEQQLQMTELALESCEYPDNRALYEEATATEERNTELEHQWRRRQLEQLRRRGR